MPRQSFRAFSADLEKLAQQWAGTAVTNEKWIDHGPFAQTESKPFKVSCGEVVGIAKPGEKKTDGICRAAHEKIASDLAFELGLPIPPVVLLDMGELQDAKRERHVSISAFAFPQPIPWDKATTLTEQHKNDASEVMSAMLAFETWVSCTDRKSDHVLVYFASSTDPVQLAFVDFAYAMSQQWGRADDPAGATHPYLPVQKDDATAKATVERIEQFDDEKVKAIVGRIPVEYLPEDKRALIIANLKYRKPRLRTLLGIK